MDRISGVAGAFAIVSLAIQIGDGINKL